MSPEPKVDAEQNVRRHCEQRDYDQATTAALQAYGNEVLRFLVAFQKNETVAADVFSVFAEDLWRSMETFAWECSLRTWAYTLARRASFRAGRRKRHAAASPSVISKLAQQIRTETLTFLRTEKRTRIRALRDSLPEEDQALLVLRVDRGLAWDELARVLSETDLDSDALLREAARLRKRFQLVKEKLKTLAKKEGLYKSREEE